MACESASETMNHLMHCRSYKSETFSDWEDLFGNDTDKQISGGLAIENRFGEREDMMKKQEDGRSQDFDSTAPGDC